jgi:hypothetical protein
MREVFGRGFVTPQGGTSVQQAFTRLRISRVFWQNPLLRLY